MVTESTKPSITKACITCGQEFEDAPDNCPTDGTPLAVIATELTPGTVLSDRYEVIGAVSGGGMGKVYKARHKLMNRVVAIKTIHSHLISSGAILKRFQQEAQAISALSHPNILTVFDFFVSEDGQPYLVMDYLEGTNLQELIQKERPLKVDRALPIFIATCAGLAHAHEHGVIHRDIKPSNIMLVPFDGADDFVKIVDFGIAKVLADEKEAGNLTATGDVFGSPDYMSPEQCRAKPPDARSDVYSLGCVMYSSLSGILPFSGQDSIESMYKQVHETAKPLHMVCPNIQFPKGLEALIHKALEKEPEQRFQSMNDLKEALISIQNELNRVNDATTKHYPASSPTSGEHSGVEFLTKIRQKLMLVMVLVLLAASGFLVYQLNQQRPSSIRRTIRPIITGGSSSSQSDESGDHEVNYQSEYVAGLAAYQRGSYQNAKEHFKLAHEKAQDFGQGDMRFIDSLYWAAKCDLGSGNYAQAKIELQWVLSTLKSRYGLKSPGVQAAEADLKKAKQALRQK